MRSHRCLPKLHPWIDEIGELQPLRHVLLHRPGRELATRLTPSNKDALLFDELPWVERAQEEHLVRERPAQPWRTRPVRCRPAGRRARGCRGAGRSPAAGTCVSRLDARARSRGQRLGSCSPHWRLPSGSSGASPSRSFPWEPRPCPRASRAARTSYSPHCQMNSSSHATVRCGSPDSVRVCTMAHPAR